MRNAKRFKLTLRNFIRGAIYSICTSISVEVANGIINWQTYNDINFQRISLVVIATLISYLTNKLVQNEQGNYTK